ncbi:MAG: hypothetical protein U9R17_07900, partial [Thermodesulfobacteriota bacterium]|nr:hypothetical protein [Thermodesulfobacteriota bacterium]
PKRKQMSRFFIQISRYLISKNPYEKPLKDSTGLEDNLETLALHRERWRKIFFTETLNTFLKTEI